MAERVDWRTIDYLSIWIQHIKEVLFQIKLNLFLCLITFFSRLLCKSKETFFVCKLSLQKNLHLLFELLISGTLFDFINIFGIFFLVNNKVCFHFSLHQLAFVQKLKQVEIVLHFCVVPQDSVLVLYFLLCELAVIVFLTLMLCLCKLEQSKFYRFVLHLFSFFILHCSLFSAFFLVKPRNVIQSLPQKHRYYKCVKYPLF
jgi:hypothetical protein